MKFFLIAVFLSFWSVSFALPVAIQLPDLKEAATAKKPTSAQVTKAAQNFANDANTVSSSLNSLGTTTDTKTIKSLATTAFKAETDEDTQRATLNAAAGSAGSASNDKIVKNTPAVLTGLKNIMNSPTTKTTATNLKTIEAARNPQILPSITQLSNSALKSVGMPATAQKFAATTGSQKIAAAKGN